MIDIRRYREFDAAACCTVINEAIIDMDGLNTAARRFVVAKNVPAILHDELHQVYALVAEQEGRVIAVGALDDGEIRRLYVHPDAQQHGAGDALLGALEAEARRCGTEIARLDASPSSAGFYERRGYTAAPIQRSTVGTAEFTVVPMHKRLA